MKRTQIMHAQAQTGEHQPVMLHEALEGLQIKPAGRYLDATFGRGGHSRAILARLGGEGRLLGFDRDPQACLAGESLAAADARLSIRHANFADLALELEAGTWDGVLFDFGVSSPQLDQAERGFSFMRDGPLDMRMDPGHGPSAAEWLGIVAESDLGQVLEQWGEERHARRLARAIVARRATEPFQRTLELAEFIASQLPRVYTGIHPATRAFQAIRIAVNDELGAIDRGLDAAHRVLAPGGRLVAISFHSLEDRRVKTFVQQHSRQPQASRRLPPIASAPSTLIDLGKRRASDAEVARNPRSRSAVMRVAERVA